MNHDAAATPDKPLTKFGELLGKIIPLSRHDVEEILQEQAASRRKFGDAALSLGLCRPEHVLQAWLRQLEASTPRVPLGALGVDAQATAHVPASVARRLRLVPVRVADDALLVAASAVPSAEAVAEVEAAAGRRVRVVLAAEDEVGVALERYYPALAA